MSHRSGRGDRSGALVPDSGVEALRRNPELHGPAEPPAHDHGDEESNDHFASVYEGREEQFAAAVPFVRQGIERGERCLYIADGNSRAEVLEALREGGIDVDAALESGALSIHTKADTYLRTGEFDRDGMLAFWEDALERATDGGDYTGIRAAAEMTWALDADASLDRLVEYEAMLNSLFADEDYVVLCQYDRERFPPEVVRDVIRTHPHLIHGDRVSHNVYYTPPEEFFGPDNAAREVDRMLGTLRERTEAKTELKARQRYLREQNEITACPDRTFEEKLQALFELGCERFDLEFGGLARVDPETDEFEIEYTSDERDRFEPGVDLPLSETYCTAVTETEGPASVSDPLADGYGDTTVYRDLGLKAYLGTYVEVDGDRDRTFFFVSSEPREEAFSEAERTFHHLMGQWVQYELERRQRERHQRTLYEIASDADRTFEEKLQALFELGCERFDLERGGLARIEPETDLFEVEALSGDHEHLVPGARVALSETYCRVFTDDTDVAGITDPPDRGFADTLAYDEFGVKTYLGTHVELDDDLDRTLFFVSSEPREEAFSEAERTFHHLMGQWVQYELERRRHEAELQQSKERFKRIFESSHDAIFILDPEADECVDANPAAYEMLGYTRDELLSLGPSDLFPDERDGFREFVDGTCEGTGWRDELTCLPADGESIPAAISASPIEIDDRQYALAIVRDVSDRKEWERQLERKNERLESFASMLAHELRNPVMIGQIYSQQLPADVEPEPVEHVTDAFDRIEAMVDVMLVLTRGREAVGERTPVDVAERARVAWAEVDAPDATLETSIDRTILVDETYVRHLFRNLFENAVQHGGSDVTVRVGELPTGFYVADDGPGIPADERDAVFRPGYTTTPDEGGTGIGLAFVRELTDAYRWTCTVTESAAGGARFEFTNVGRDSSRD